VPTVNLRQLLDRAGEGLRGLPRRLNLHSINIHFFWTLHHRCGLRDNQMVSLVNRVPIVFVLQRLAAYTVVSWQFHQIVLGCIAIQGRVKLSIL